MSRPPSSSPPLLPTPGTSSSHPVPHSNQQQQPLLPHPHHAHQHHPHAGYANAPPPGMGFQQQRGAPPQGYPQQPQQHQQQQQYAAPPQHFMPPPPQHQQQSSQQQEHDPFLQHVVSASLVDLLGKQILVLLRDGRKLIGELLSFDQYSNIVISGAVERKVLGNSYYDEPLGLYVIRGENVVLLGDQHPGRLARHQPPIEFKPVTKEEFALLEEEDKKKKEAEGKKSTVRPADEDDLM